MPTGDMPTGDMPTGDMPTGDISNDDMYIMPIKREDAVYIYNETTNEYLCNDKNYKLTFFEDNTFIEIFDGFPREGKWEYTGNDDDNNNDNDDDNDDGN